MSCGVVWALREVTDKLNGAWIGKGLGTPWEMAVITTLSVFVVL